MMFGEDRRVAALRRELDDLRNYCVKFTQEVNTWAQMQGKQVHELELKVKQLEEK